MPIYIYKHPDKEEYLEEMQGMNDKHVYFDSDGLQWKRIFTIPNASIDTSVDPYSSKEFIQKTENKKGTYGDMMDYSKELSYERSEKNGGVDPVKEKYYKDYSAKRKGEKHFNEIKEKKHKSSIVDVDYGK